ncbi:MAG: hypothetical protein SWZ49_10075 [Cyanobacteriota bacterium]|jgi:chromosome segregation ATPase|nr:hypothetical protein [Cyanobacteriota bacterium]
MTQIEDRLTQLEDAQRRTQSQINQLVEVQLQTQVSIGQMSNRVGQLSSRVDEFVFQSQRLFGQQATRLINVEGQTERFEAVIRKLDRNYEEQKANLNEYRKTTNATLERIDRILDYLVKGSGDSENS